MDVLLIEYNDDDLLKEASVIKEFQCKVDTASNNSVAWELLNNNTYDLVFMDVSLPVMGVIELAEKIRTTRGNNQTVPLVALTTYEDAEHQIQAINIGMNAYIVKPLVAEKCKKILKQYGY